MCNFCRFRIQSITVVIGEIYDLVALRWDTLIKKKVNYLLCDLYMLEFTSHIEIEF